MGLDVGFLTLLGAAVTVTPSTGEDGWGNATYGAPFSAKAFIDPTVSSLGTQDHQHQDTLVSIGTKLIMDAVGVKPRDRITLNEGTIFFVVGVSTAKDEFGADLYQEVTAQTTEKG